MKLLCILVLIIVVSSNAATTPATEFYGIWTMVDLLKYVDTAVSLSGNHRCSKQEIGPVETKHSCNGVEIQYFKVTQLAKGTEQSAHFPIVIADTHEEALDYSKSCICTNVCGYEVFRKLGDNYMVMFNFSQANPVLVETVFAKSVPSLTELEANIHNRNEFKNKDRIEGTLCTSDSNN